MPGKLVGWFMWTKGWDKVWEVEVFWSSGADWGRYVPGRVHEVGVSLVVVLTGGFGLWVGGVLGLWCGFAFLFVSSLHSCKGSG